MKAGSALTHPLPPAQMSPQESTSQSTSEPREPGLSAEVTHDILQEMEQLRERVSELQARLDDEASDKQRRAVRKPFAVQLRFIMDFDVATGQALDLSDTGIAVRVSDPMPFALRYAENGEQITRFAKLVYAANDNDGTHRLGFEFIEEDPRTSF